MIKKTSLLAVLALATLGFAGPAAADIDYTYVDLAYHDIDFDGVAGDGFSLGGSYALGNTAYISGGYGTHGFDESGVSFDATQLNIAFGGHWALSNTADWIAEAGVIRDDSDLSISGFGSGEESDTGFFLSTGLRVMVTDRLELNGGLTYADIYNDNSTAFGLGARYEFTDSFSVGFGYTTGDDVDTITLGARFGG